MEENNPQQNIPYLCHQGCGFYGSPNFDGLCSKCHRDAQHQQQQQQQQSQPKDQEPLGDVEQKVVDDCIKAAESHVDNTATDSTPSSESRDAEKNEELPESAIALDADSLEGMLEDSSASSSAPSTPKPKKRNRCFLCKKKVGLTGFSCHCGETFCSNHRYADSHECLFDYRQLGQSDIRRANPQVTAAKVQKI